MCLSNTIRLEKLQTRYDMVSYYIYACYVLRWVWPWLYLVFHNDSHCACVWVWTGLNIHGLCAPCYEYGTLTAPHVLQWLIINVWACGCMWVGGGVEQGLVINLSIPRPWLYYCMYYWPACWYWSDQLREVLYMREEKKFKVPTPGRLIALTVVQTRFKLQAGI